VCLLGSLACAILLFLASPSAFAGTRPAAGRSLSGSSVARAGAANRPGRSLSAAIDAAIQRVGRPGAQLHTALHAPNGPQETSVTARNWAGYDVTGAGLTSVTASWVVSPVSAANAALTYASFWVGLDGDTSATAEQTGTAACSQNGRTSYYAWYEMYPAAEVPITALTVSPGDLMTATVSTDGQGRFTLTLADDTTRDSFSVTKSSAVTTPHSAEIVAEAPTDASIGRLIPLADFGRVDFTNCAFNGRPLSAFSRNQIGMVASDGSPLAAASTLGHDGASFSVCQCAGDTTAPTTIATGADDLWHNRPVTVRLGASDNPGGSGVSYTEYKLDKDAWTRATSLTIPAPADHANDGSHTVLYRSVDGAGNAETPRICSVDIDTCPPKPVADRAAIVTRGHTATLAFCVDEPQTGRGTATVTIKIKTSAGQLVKTLVRGGAAVNTRRAERFTCRLATGHYRFYVYATDAAGNAQSSASSNQLTVS
jgi:hypothetical protein